MNVGMYLAVAAGGAIGAMLRYAVAQVTAVGMFNIAGPMATLAVNIAGSAIMGLVAGLAASGFILPEAWRGFLAVGLLGALTTFSSFALDAGALFQKQGLAMACIYVGLSVCLLLASFALCFWLVRMPS
ncbi:MAG: CrcB family protein [Alphaproteobacteria bacterium]